MNIETLIQRNLAIVYDQDMITDPAPAMFDPDAWRAMNAVSGVAQGRGQALFLETPYGEAVLRQYRRGGWAAIISEDRYWFMGFHASRPFREFHLLARMHQSGLPVPLPLAALCIRHGLFYRGALLTRTISGVRSLADMLSGGMPEGAWESVGACIRRFHAAGVQHADLNARNILLRNGGEEVFLLDFDRGSMNPGAMADGSRNLARLRRSLKKLWPPGSQHSLEACWSKLIEGYGV